MFEDLFYDRLIKLRAEKGVSAREMSLAIGQSPGYINGLENRNGFPSMQVFFYICEYLGVTPSEFFDNGNSYPIEYRRLLKDMDALDEESRRNESFEVSSQIRYNGKYEQFAMTGGYSMKKKRFFTKIWRPCLPTWP